MELTGYLLGASETRYLKMGKFLPKTTSRSHLAALLYNIWVTFKAHAKECFKLRKL